MSGLQRYAIYHLPDDARLSDFGAFWLGWDPVAGAPRDQPPVPGIAEMTLMPRKYGFHATLKPPFRLAAGANADDLAEAVRAFASESAAFCLDGLRLARMGRFLALVPVGDTAQLNGFALDCLAELDRFRRPGNAAELARRRSAGLTQRQEFLLSRWGYPFVADEFAFHLTLTGKLDDEGLVRAREALELWLPPLPQPFGINSISLVGEGRDGMFRMIDHHELSG